MNQERVQAAIKQLLQRIRMEYGNEFESRIFVQSPICYLDQESYDLLVRRTGGFGYQYLFNRAVREIKPIVSMEQLTQVIAAVRKGRSGRRSKTVYTKIGQNEYKWVEEMARAMQLKKSRVMEAVIFLYLRAESQEAAGEN